MVRILGTSLNEMLKTEKHGGWRRQLTYGKQNDLLEYTNFNLVTKIKYKHNHAEETTSYV